jgi:hypothetical protein
MSWLFDPLIRLGQFVITFFSSRSLSVKQAPAAPTSPVATPKPAPATPTPPSPLVPQASLLEPFVQEIKNMEGWAPGSTSFTCNNPGNLRCTPGQPATWNVLATGSRGGFCTFPDEPTGMQALRDTITSCAKGLSPNYNAAAQKLGLHDSGYLNLYQFFTIRDPASDGNDPTALAERFGRVLGANPSTFLMRQLLLGQPPPLSA